MKRQIAVPSRSDCLSPTDPRLLGNPLDFIAEDHLRERQICALIDGIANAAGLDTSDVDNVLSFLGEELGMHLQDEDDGLFPLMRKKCEAEDQIDDVIERLQSDHMKITAVAPKIGQSLQRLLDGQPALNDGDRTMLSEFANDTRRHLIVENAIILPIARARLNAADLDSLRSGMLKRRGLDRLMEDENAD